jgi:hypothetical protein
VWDLEGTRRVSLFQVCTLAEEEGFGSVLPLGGGVLGGGHPSMSLSSTSIAHSRSLFK